MKREGERETIMSWFAYFKMQLEEEGMEREGEKEREKVRKPLGVQVLDRERKVQGCSLFGLREMTNGRQFRTALVN